MYLNHIQLKSARGALNLGVRDIGLLIQTSRTTVSKLEHNTINILTMRLAKRRNVILKEFFKQNKIVFPNSYSIELIHFNDYNRFEPLSIEAITRFQLKVSRIIFNKTQADLAKIVGVSPSLIKKAESYSNQFLLKADNLKAVFDLLNLFKKEGLEYPSPYLVSFQNFS